MGKVEFIKSVAKKADVTQEIAEKVNNALFETLIDTVIEDGKIQISSFGTFEIRECAERIGRNPQTGEQITIPARKAISFKASKILKDQVNM